jgi:TonB family protein
VGAFDLPSGSGQGNGSGGSKGARGTVANSGFGDGIAGSGSGDRAHRSISTGGFGDATPTTSTARASIEKAQVTPVEILYKPRPVYNEEARKQHIEGEVLLDVNFAASGKVNVLRVVKGLGHGLDEAAMRCAEQIRFHPATRSGQPFDSDAVVHIVFALAE